MSVFKKEYTRQNLSGYNRDEHRQGLGMVTADVRRSSISLTAKVVYDQWSKAVATVSKSDISGSKLRKKMPCVMRHMFVLENRMDQATSMGMKVEWMKAIYTSGN